MSVNTTNKYLSIDLEAIREALAKAKPFLKEGRSFGLGPGQGADAQIAPAVQVLGEDAPRRAFADAGFAHDPSKAAFADLMFHAPAEALDGRGHPQGRGGHVRAEGVEP